MKFFLATPMLHDIFNAVAQENLRNMVDCVSNDGFVRIYVKLCLVMSCKIVHSSGNNRCCELCPCISTLNQFKWAESFHIHKSQRMNSIVANENDGINRCHGARISLHRDESINPPQKYVVVVVMMFFLLRRFFFSVSVIVQRKGPVPYSAYSSIIFGNALTEASHCD